MRRMEAVVTTATEQTEKAKALAEAQPEVQLPPAANVIEALTRVMRELPAIGKDQEASQKQGGYAYRGIEQITRHTQGLFAKHGIVFVPHVRSYDVREIVVNSNPWTDTYELVEYTVYGPGGLEDRITVGPVLAIGRDNSDKGANKCLTQAFKYALLQALCISDAKDDGDADTHVAEVRGPREPAPPRGGVKTCEFCGGSMAGENRPAVLGPGRVAHEKCANAPAGPDPELAPGPGQQTIDGGET